MSNKGPGKLNFDFQTHSKSIAQFFWLIKHYAIFQLRLKHENDQNCTNKNFVTSKGKRLNESRDWKKLQIYQWRSYSSFKIPNHITITFWHPPFDLLFCNLVDEITYFEGPPYGPPVSPPPSGPIKVHIYSTETSCCTKHHEPRVTYS